MFVCAECGASQPVAGRCPADGTPLAPVTDDQMLGQTIGAYRVARLLGVGGMGRVYKGVQPQIGSRVAIKVLSRECSDRRDLVDRFFAEAKAVNLIRHESIVNVLDLSVLPDGRPFIIMEYLDGAPLSWIIEQARHHGQPLPLGGLARLAAEVLDALGAAHAKGIIHRDLKPDNVYVTPSGRPKVLDFGIAKLQPELGGSATHTGSLLGTPHYMSPEQAASRPVDARADLYAMGVILFECATLQKPFTADSLYALLRMHVEMPPPSPRALRRDMPPDLEHVIFTAMAKLPEQRFASAEAMSAALQHATAQLAPDQWAPITPVQGARPASWSPTPPASWARRAQQPTTVSAGQVTAPPAKSKALWIALAAIALVGIGVTAAVVAGGGGGSGPGSGSAVATGSGSAKVEEVVAKAPEPEKPEKEAEEQAPGIPDISNMLDEDDAGAILEAYIQATPAAQLPKPLRDALKKYGSYDKIPKNERAKIAGAMLAQVNGIQTDVAKQVNQALSQAGVPPQSATPAAPGGWFTRHSVTPPGFNPKHANVDQVIQWALAEAKKNVPDAELIWIDATGVYPDGHADLTLPNFASEHGGITLRFVSPSHQKRDPSTPRGVAQTYKQCSFYIVLEPGENEIYDTSSEMLCKEHPIPHPHCSVAAVWKKAIAAKKDIADAVASITYRSNGWNFEIREGTERPIFDETYRDDCK
jgi:serine/threonine protein kinase